MLEYASDKHALLLLLQLMSEFPALEDFLIEEFLCPLPEEFHDRFHNKGPQAIKSVQVEVPHGLSTSEAFFWVL